MSLNRLLNQPLEILPRSSGVDEYGNETAGVGGPVATTGYLEQTESTERVSDRETVEVFRKVWLRAGEKVGPLDRIRFDGATFEVVGEPDKVWNPRTRSLSHIVCRLESVQGG